MYRSLAMNAATPMAAVCASSAQSRDQLLAATAQASRLLLESPDVMARMPEVLQLIGEAAGVDRTTLALAQIGPDGANWLEIKAQWSAPGIAASEGRDAGIEWNPRRTDCFCAEFSAGRSVYLCKDDWPADSSIASNSAKSSIIVPFLVDEEYAGAVGFDAFRSERRFEQAVVSALEIAASIIGAALHRSRLLDTMRREREQAAEQRVAELARANAALRANLERLACQPAELFSHLLLETMRHAGAEAATSLASGYESDDWQVVCHSRDGGITAAEFAASIPARDSRFMQQMLTLRDPLHLPLQDGTALPDWPELIDFHREAGHGSLYVLPLVFGE